MNTPLSFNTSRNKRLQQDTLPFLQKCSMAQKYSVLTQISYKEKDCARLSP